MKNYVQMCAGVKKNLTELTDLRIGLRLTRLGLDGLDRRAVSALSPSAQAERQEKVE